MSLARSEAPVEEKESCKAAGISVERKVYNFSNEGHHRTSMTSKGIHQVRILLNVGPLSKFRWKRLQTPSEDISTPSKTALTPSEARPQKSAILKGL
jgi:hypothetical protein